MKINNDDRYTKGSFEERLSPKIANTGLNQRLGPPFPVKQEPKGQYRKSLAGMDKSENK